MRRLRVWSSHAVVAIVCLILSPGRASAQVIVPPGMGVAAGQTVPTPGFDLTLAALAAGDYTAGLELATREYKGGMRIGAKRWIDSIAAAAAAAAVTRRRP